MFAYATDIAFDKKDLTLEITPEYRDVVSSLADSIGIDGNLNILHDAKILHKDDEVNKDKRVVGDGSRIYLQSLTSGASGWSLILNNKIISKQSKSKNFNNLFDVTSVTASGAKLKFTGPVDAMIRLIESRDAEATDHNITIVEHASTGEKELFIKLGLNQFFDLTNGAIYSGNMQYSTARPSKEE